MNRKLNLEVLINVIGISFLIVMILFSLSYPINAVVNERQVICTVTEKGIKNQITGSKYLIYTTDETGAVQVFEITDNLLKFRFDSSDLYAQINENTSYCFTICGSRVKILSWYPNIYELKEIETTITEAENP